LARKVLWKLMKALAMVAILFSFLIAPAWTGSHRALAAEADAKAAAREHFQNGLAAFADQRFGEAADEFDQAYKLSPAFKLLYNIGLVNAALGRSVEAVDAFEKYLKQGASAIPAERRREVGEEIEKQRGRIGTVSIRTFPEAAEIRVDGQPSGKTPFAKPLPLNLGRHTIEASLDGHSTQTREIEVSGKSEIAIEMTLDVIAAPVPAPSPAPVTPVGPPPTAVAPPAIQSPPVVEKVIIETPASASVGVAKAEGPQASPNVSGSSVSWQRIGGIVVIAAGIATATVGGVDAYRGSNQTNDASNRLANATTNEEYDAALPDFNAGKSLNQRGWIIAGVGAALFVGGIVLVATAPASGSEKSNAVSLASWVTAESGGVVVRGAW
jgi:tetratricopeptide (TPR) repeat protein